MRCCESLLVPAIDVGDEFTLLYLLLWTFHEGSGSFRKGTNHPKKWGFVFEDWSQELFLPFIWNRHAGLCSCTSAGLQARPALTSHGLHANYILIETSVAQLRCPPGWIVDIRTIC